MQTVAEKQWLVLVLSKAVRQPWPLARASGYISSSFSSFGKGRIGIPLRGRRLRRLESVDAVRWLLARFLLELALLMLPSWPFGYGLHRRLAGVESCPVIQPTSPTSSSLSSSLSSPIFIFRLGYDCTNGVFPWSECASRAF